MQYATFTQVQQISEMADSMDLVRNNLIGKSSHESYQQQYRRKQATNVGVVDYVVVEEV